MTANHSERDLPNLDLLRAVAVLMVYFAHLAMACGIDKRWTVLPVYELSQAGVMIFFVHTSFVLMLSLERQRERGFTWFRNFYIRRAFRIYPLSIAAVIFVLAASVPRFPGQSFQRPTVTTVIANLALVQNLIRWRPPVLYVLWSLPYEIQMYVALPFLFVLLRKRPAWASIATWLATVVVLTFVHVKGLGVLLYVPCFLGGVVAYRYWRAPRLQLASWFWPLAIAAAIGIRLIHPVTLLSAWCASLLLGLCIPQFRQLQARTVTAPSFAIAKYSYGIYLSHTIIFSVFLPARPVMVASLSVLVPVALYYVLENPMVELGKRITRGQPAGEVPSYHFSADAKLQSPNTLT